MSVLRFPYILYSDAAELRPVFSGLKGDPFILDLSPAGTLLDEGAPRDQTGFQRRIEEKMAGRFTWGVSSYLEDRRTLLADCPQMVKEGRFFHLGLDVIVPLGTPLHAPLAGTVREAGYEAGEGNYGGYVLLEHQSPRFETFYSLYGHLNTDTLPAEGTAVAAGDSFARIGDFHENGNWFYHTHIQVITEKGFEAGYVSRGYCAEGDLRLIEGLCPSPIPLFRI